jgi:hypothetical protein
MKMYNIKLLKKIPTSLTKTCFMMFLMFSTFSVVFAANDFEFSSLRVVNFFGDPISNIDPGQQVQFSADIKNNKDAQEEFAFVLTTDNLQNHASWVTGLASPGQSLSLSISHTFDLEGSYQATAYLTNLPKDVLDQNDLTDYSPFALSENHLANPISINVIVGGTESSSSSSSSSSSPTNEPVQDPVVEKIPSWLKDTVGLWSDRVLGDSEFSLVIEYLRSENIISIPDLPEQTSETVEIPIWVRNIAGWWADGLISEESFVNVIKYLVEEGVIRV